MPFYSSVVLNISIKSDEHKLKTTVCGGELFISLNAIIWSERVQVQKGNGSMSLKLDGFYQSGVRSLTHQRS